MSFSNEIIEEFVYIYKVKAIYKYSKIASLLGKHNIIESDIPDLFKIAKKSKFFESVTNIKKQYSSLQSRSKSKAFNGDFESYYKWFKNQRKYCYYCEQQEKDISKFLKNLSEKNGYHKRSNRGQVLEIDQKIPNKGYNESNCVLSCYICNNAKSDIFDAIEFKKTIGNSIGELIRTKI